MTLTVEMLERFKAFKQTLTDLTQTESLYLNYLFFYLVCDRDRCQYVKEQDAYLLINVNCIPAHVVSVATLEIIDYEPGTSIYRKDSIRAKAESLPLNKETKLKLIDLLSVEAANFTVKEKARLRRAFHNHSIILRNKPKET